MTRTTIALDTLSLPVFHVFDARWMLLAAGDFAARDYNCMTISWGCLGVIWAKPCAVVLVRQSRYTRGFMEKGKSFTLSLFPDSFHEALAYCGSHSGRNGDKAREAGLTAVASREVAAPSFEEAELVIECRKMYFTDLVPGNFIDPSIATHYPAQDYHRLFIGEVVAASGTASYLSRSQEPASS